MFSNKIRQSIFALLLVLSLFAPVNRRAHAEEQSNDTVPVQATILTVAPVLNELAMKPGESTDQKINVTNQARLPIPIKAYTRAFVATDENGGSDYPDEKDPHEVQHWFTIDQPDFILQPGMTREVRIKIDVPADARPGGHYATLFFESLIPKEAISQSSFFMSSRIGALFFFVIAGDLVEKGSVSELTTQKTWTHGPIDFNVAFKNEGNVDLRPKSTLTIKDMSGRDVVKINDNGQRTLPQKTRRWKVTWDAHWLFGYYTAVLESRNTIDASPQTTKVTFFVVPYYHIGAVIVTLILVYLIFFKGRDRMKKALKALKEPEEDVAHYIFSLSQKGEVKKTPKK